MKFRDGSDFPPGDHRSRPGLLFCSIQFGRSDRPFDMCDHFSPKQLRFQTKGFNFKQYMLRLRRDRLTDYDDSAAGAIPSNLFFPLPNRHRAFVAEILGLIMRSGIGGDKRNESCGLGSLKAPCVKL